MRSDRTHQCPSCFGSGTVCIGDKTSVLTDEDKIVLEVQQCEYCKGTGKVPKELAEGYHIDTQLPDINEQFNDEQEYETD